MRAAAAAGVLALCVASGVVGWLAGRASAPAAVSSDGAADGAADVATSGRSGTEAPQREHTPAPRPRARAAAPEPSPESPEPATVPPAGSESHVLPVPDDAAKIGSRLTELVGGDIDPRRVADVAARSRALRTQMLAAADLSDVTAERQVAEEIRKERAFLADAARGGTMQMLRGIAKQQVRMFDLVGDRPAFAAHFQRKGTGPVADGQLWKGEKLADGTTLRFPSGSWTWSVRSFRSAKEFPRDLTIEGAGMDATLVRLDELDADVEITNLTFRDCTIDCGDDYLTDLRSEAPITLRLERCRVTGFDMAAGGSVMLSAHAAAFFATDCRFEAGYGRQPPGHGNLFRVESGLLVRCENCVFRGPFTSVWDANDSATYVFSACRFERMNARFANALTTPPAGVRFEGCTATEPLEPGTKLEKRPLSDFNASWPSKTR